MPAGHGTAQEVSGETAASKRGSVAGTPARLAAGLHLVATPIGNLGDITLRALETLRAVDLIACEDTRVSAVLLRRYGIETAMTTYHEHNAERRRPELLARLGRGESVALISDAGTPLVSDPGYKLVREAIAAGYAVHVLPGPSASIAALLLSGVPTDRFMFAGFLPAKPTARRRELTALAAISATLVIYESGNRLAEALADMGAALGDRAAAVARELTKLHEEVRRGKLSELAAHYAAHGAPKGEIVLVIAPPLPPAPPDEAKLDAALREAMREATLSEAVPLVARSLGLPRREVYARALRLGSDEPR